MVWSLCGVVWCGVVYTAHGVENGVIRLESENCAQSPSLLHLEEAQEDGRKPDLQEKLNGG